MLVSCVGVLQVFWLLCLLFQCPATALPHPGGQKERIECLGPHHLCVARQGSARLLASAWWSAGHGELVGSVAANTRVSLLFFPSLCSSAFHNHFIK